MISFIISLFPFLVLCLPGDVTISLSNNLQPAQTETYEESIRSGARLLVSLEGGYWIDEPNKVKMVQTRMVCSSQSPYGFAARNSLGKVVTVVTRVNSATQLVVMMRDPLYTITSEETITLVNLTEIANVVVRSNPYFTIKPLMFTLVRMTSPATPSVTEVEIRRGVASVSVVIEYDTWKDPQGVISSPTMAFPNLAIPVVYPDKPNVAVFQLRNGDVRYNTDKEEIVSIAVENRHVMKNNLPDRSIKSSFSFKITPIIPGGVTCSTSKPSVTENEIRKGLLPSFIICSITRNIENFRANDEGNITLGFGISVPRVTTRSPLPNSLIIEWVKPTLTPNIIDVAEKTPVVFNFPNTSVLMFELYAPSTTTFFVEPSAGIIEVDSTYLTLNERDLRTGQAKMIFTFIGESMSANPNYDDFRGNVTNANGATYTLFLKALPTLLSNNALINESTYVVRLQFTALPTFDIDVPEKISFRFPPSCLKSGLNVEKMCGGTSCDVTIMTSAQGEVFMVPAAVQFSEADIQTGNAQWFVNIQGDTFLDRPDRSWISALLQPDTLGTRILSSMKIELMNLNRTQIKISISSISEYRLQSPKQTITIRISNSAVKKGTTPEILSPMIITIMPFSPTPTNQSIAPNATASSTIPPAPVPTPPNPNPNNGGGGGGGGATTTPNPTSTPASTNISAEENAFSLGVIIALICLILFLAGAGYLLWMGKGRLEAAKRKALRIQKPQPEDSLHRNQEDTSPKGTDADTQSQSQKSTGGFSQIVAPKIFFDTGVVTDELDANGQPIISTQKVSVDMSTSTVDAPWMYFPPIRVTNHKIQPDEKAPIDEIPITSPIQKQHQESGNAIVPMEVEDDHTIVQVRVQPRKVANRAKTGKSGPLVHQSMSPPSRAQMKTAGNVGTPEDRFWTNFVRMYDAQDRDRSLQGHAQKFEITNKPQTKQRRRDEFV